MSEPKTRREVGLMATAGLVASALAATSSKSAAANQPNMERARAALGEALHFLQIAEADKGGYREAAIRSVSDAIGQVDAGMRWAATH